MGIYQKPCLGKGSNYRHRGPESPYLDTNFALGTQIAKQVGFFRGRCGGNRELSSQHTQSLNFMTVLLMLSPAPVFFLVSQHRYRKQLRAEITNNSSITNTIFISCTTSFHNLCFSGRDYSLWSGCARKPLSKSRGSCRCSSDITKSSAKPLLLVGASQQNELQENLERMYHLVLLLPLTNIKMSPTGLTSQPENMPGNASTHKRINYWSSKQCAMHSLCSLPSCTLY